MSNKEKQYLQYIEHSQLRSSCFKPSHSGVGVAAQISNINKIKTNISMFDLVFIWLFSYFMH